MSISHREGVARLSAALFELHGLLVEDAKTEHQKNEGPIAGPGHLLQLLTEHSTFAWLRPLSSHMAELDHADRTNDDALLVTELRAIGALLAPGSLFAERYFETFQRSPEVVMAHATALAALRATQVVN